MGDQPGHLFKELKALVRVAEYEGVKARQLAVTIGRELPKPDRIGADNIEEIKALVLLAEVWDYYGMFTTARELSAVALRIVKLGDSTTVRPENAELMQSKVRLMVAYARALYRSGDRKTAIEKLLTCREYVLKCLATEKFPCYGTLGEIAYMLGRAYRQGQHFARAFSEFTEAIRLYDERADHKRRTQPERLDHTLFSAHKVAVISALGVSWCNYAQGSLRIALYTNLVPARAILRQSRDVLNQAYADVIAASIARASTANNRKILARVREDVETALKVFLDYGHRHYAAGAALELALLALAEKRISKAREYWQLLQEYAEGEDSRWKISALIVESRVLRHEANKPEALLAATRAHDLAKQQGEVFGQIDALLARSESYGSREHTSAIEDLQVALRLNGRAHDDSSGWNPKVHATCNLHLVQHFLKLSRVYDALESFAQWQKVRDRVEHMGIHQAAERVATMLDQCDRLEFRAQDGLDYKENNRRLREFLLRQARMRHRKQDDMKRTLGISRGLLNEWISEFGPECQKMDKKCKPR